VGSLLEISPDVHREPSAGQSRKGYTTFFFLFSALLFSALPEVFGFTTEGPAEIDLCEAVIVSLSSGKIQSNAADMLRDEIEKRTRIGLDVVSEMPASNKVVILVGKAEDLANKSFSPVGISVPSKAEGYALWVDTSKRKAATVCALGRDDRGTLYAVGRLLRLLDMSRDEVKLAGDIRIATSPKYPLRGHQFGYRPKTNAYDGWDMDMWEQYYRDMIAFGMNAIELIPPVSDDESDSPHFPQPKMEMMIKMSKLADDYGLDVWIWYPVVDDEDLDEGALDEMMSGRADVLKKLPRVDAVFVPGGDPGEIHPDKLLPLCEQMKKVLNRYHPKAQVWVSPQGFDHEEETRGWLQAFYDILQNERPDWLDGVVYGPQVETTLARLRAALPERYPIRRYPDITHCLDSQYQVPNWDPALYATLYREPINPRPKAYAKIFKDWDEYTIGYITYSEGTNDDLNKIIWASLGWDPEMKVKDILREYSRYFISRRYEGKFAEGLLGLERNWQGLLLTNIGVYKTLKLFRQMEEGATPQEKLNWRFQIALYRAYYDAYIRRRLIYETELEEKAMDVLRMADKLGSLKALELAENILDRAETHKVGKDLRARVFELAEALFQSIHMQLSVKRYQATSIRRGANLDLIDKHLNNSERLKDLFDDIRELGSERRRLARIAEITAECYRMKTEHDRKVIREGVQ